MSTLTAFNFSNLADSPSNVVPQNFSRAPTLVFGPKVSDEALLEAIAQGDRHAMELLYGRHSVRVYRFVLRMTGDAASAEDLVSEVFLEVWRHADGFGARSQVSTWLLAIARNKTLSAFRRRSDEQLDEHGVAAIEDPADDPETSVQKQARSAVIQGCLSQLSEAHREVIDLIYYHEKTLEEVALIVGAPLSTIKTRVFYARQRMDKFLRAAGFDEQSLH